LEGKSRPDAKSPRADGAGAVTRSLGGGIYG
jgi:hypothetical protein